MILDIREKELNYPKLSYVSGTGSKPLMYKTIGQQLMDTARMFPDKFAVYSEIENIRLTFSDVYKRARKLASGLLSLGLNESRQQKIAVYAPNGIEYHMAIMACAMAGMILVHINPANRAGELNYSLNKVGCEVLLMTTSLKSSNYDKILTDLVPEVETSKPGKIGNLGIPSLRYIVKLDNNVSQAPAFTPISTIYDAGDNEDAYNKLDCIKKDISPEDICSIYFTSGTTGSPKAAALTHFSVLNNASLLSDSLKYTQKDRILSPLPLYHCAGSVICTIAALVNGCEVLYPSLTFNPEICLKVCTEKKVTAITAVPTIFMALIDALKENPGLYDVSSVRTGIVGGSICHKSVRILYNPLQVLEEIYNVFKVDGIINSYGMTETSPVIFQTSITDSFEKQLTTVGTVLPHTEVKLVDKEGKVVERNMEGQIMIRGFGVMKGYWGDQEATDECINKDGWLNTGDTGKIDDDGYLSIMGRTKNMIIRGGENVYPKEVESYLLKNPKIQSVYVFGFDDKKMVEEIFAWIKLDEGEDMSNSEVLSYCKGGISHFKIPKYVKFVDSFPLTVTGKPQVFKMKQAMVDENNRNPEKFKSYMIK